MPHLPHLGFQRVRYGGVRGYIVVQRSGDEIREIEDNGGKRHSRIVWTDGQIGQMFL